MTPYVDGINDLYSQAICTAAEAKEKAFDEDVAALAAFLQGKPVSAKKAERLAKRMLGAPRTFMAAIK